MSKARLFFLVIPALLATSVLTLAMNTSDSTINQSIFTRVSALVGRSYVEPLSEDSLYLKAAEGLIEQLNDPYSEILTPGELAQLNRSVGVRYGGLGVQIEAADDSDQAGARIVRVFPKSPAAGAGLARGDVISKIEGLSTRDWSLDKITEKLTGPINTAVKISVSRPGIDSLIQLEVVRQIVSMPTVPFTAVISDSIGYLPLITFGEGSTKEIEAAVNNLRSQGATKFILDLRANPGGRLEEAITISELFLLPNTHIASVESRQAIQEFKARHPAIISLPVAVLVNESSASASEILAGALQDNDRAFIVGQPTYGKGLVQSVFPLSSGYALKLTTGRWLTPSGRSIDRPRSEELSDDQLDSLDAFLTDTANRPVYKSNAGRVIRGGGGIVPDLIVANDTTTDIERAALGKTPRQYARLRSWLFNYAARIPANSPLSPQAIGSAKSGLIKAGIIPDSLDTSLDRLLPRLLGHAIALRAGGDREAFLFGMTHDRQIQAALRKLTPARSTNSLLSLPEVQ